MFGDCGRVRENDRLVGFVFGDCGWIEENGRMVRLKMMVKMLNCSGCQTLYHLVKMGVKSAVLVERAQLTAGHCFLFFSTRIIHILTSNK
jgi:hypothetical protein